MSRLAVVSLAAAGALLLVGSLAGCSTGTLPGSAPGGGSGTSAGSRASSTSSNPPAVSGGSSRPFTLPPACLSAAEVATTLGVDAYGPTKTGDSTSLVCEYLTPSKDGPIIDIEPSHGLTASAFLADSAKSPPVGASVSPVTGYGDAAELIKWNSGDWGIYVITGNFTIDIAGLKSSAAGVEALAKEVLVG
jgi:hypothetical protein